MEHVNVGSVGFRPTSHLGSKYDSNTNEEKKAIRRKANDSLNHFGKL
jgi:hypothetical protein